MKSFSTGMATFHVFRKGVVRLRRGKQKQVINVQLKLLYFFNISQRFKIFFPQPDVWATLGVASPLLFFRKNKCPVCLFGLRYPAWLVRSFIRKDNLPAHWFNNSRSNTPALFILWKWDRNGWSPTAIKACAFEAVCSTTPRSTNNYLPTKRKHPAR